MRRGAQFSVRQSFQHVAYIDHKCTYRGVNGEPLPLSGQQFEPGFLCAEQQGDGIDVAMRRRPDRALCRLGIERRVMQEAHDRIAVFHRRLEVIARQFEVQRDRFQDAPPRRIESVVEGFEGRPEAVDLAGPDVGRHELRQFVPVGQFATDVPEFLQVMDLRILGDFLAERRVTARAATARHVIGPLHILRQGKELFRLFLGALDQLFGNAVIAHDRKAVFGEAAAQFVGNLGKRAAEGNGCNL